MRQFKIVLFLLTVSLIAVAKDARPAQPPAAAPVQPLEQQIADLNKLNAEQRAQIKALRQDLRVQMQDDAAAQFQATSAVRKQSLMQGAGIGAGAMLLVVGVMLFARKQPQPTVTTKPQARAASA